MMDAVMRKRTPLQITALVLTCVCAALFVVTAVMGETEIADGVTGYNAAVSSVTPLLAQAVVYGLLILRGILPSPQRRVDVLVLAAFGVMLLSTVVSAVSYAQNYLELSSHYSSVVAVNRYLLQMLLPYAFFTCIYIAVVVDTLLPNNTRHLCAVVPLCILIGYHLSILLSLFPTVFWGFYSFSSSSITSSSDYYTYILLSQAESILLPVCCVLLILSRPPTAVAPPALAEEETTPADPVEETPPEPEDPLIAEVRQAYALCESEATTANEASE